MEVKTSNNDPFEISSIVNGTQNTTYQMNYSTETQIGSPSSTQTTTTASNVFISESIIQSLDANDILKNDPKATLIFNDIKAKMDNNSTNDDDESIKPQLVISYSSSNNNNNNNKRNIRSKDDLILKSNDDMLNSTNKKVKFKIESNLLRGNLSLDHSSDMSTNTDVLDLIPSDFELNIDPNESVNTESLSSCDFNQKIIVENVSYMKSFDDLQSQTIEQTLLNSKHLDSKINANSLKQSFSSTSDGTSETTLGEESTVSKMSSMLTVSVKDSSLSSQTASLKRTQAITDLHNMNEYNHVLIDITSDTKEESQLDTSTIDSHSSNKSIEYIEESKVLMEGIHVRAACLPKLLQILIDSFDELGQVMNNSNYPRVFFLMHKWFMESDELARMFYDLYEKYEVESKDLQLKTCHAFRFWIKNFPAHFGIDEALKGMISKFWNLVRSKGHKDHIKFIEVSNIESYDWIRKQTKRNPIKSKSKTEKKSELAFDKLGADVIAYQFTYLEWKTLRRITFNEYKSYAVKGSIQDNPPLERSIQLFNGMSQWIQTMVLKKTTPKQRAERIHKFIQVAQHLRQLQNFNSLMAVVGGICHSSIARLSKTNSHLSSEDQKTLNELMDLLSSNFNYAQYRKTISELKGFFIPIIGIHLKDMISLHTAHMDKLDNNLINFRKMVQLSVIFQSLNDLQNSESPVQANTSGYLEILQVALEMFYCEDEIYERSLNMEPRTSISSPSSPEKRQEFADWAKSMSTPLDPRTIKKHVIDMVNTVFKNYDHDNDGFISNEEFNEIAQNFPFIDSFAVLDADKDGLISPEEMQTYFLKANHQALKNEFKHDFHEWTYYKPTYCILCDGLLWGLIKQGWKCVDCRINAHKHCKETLVMECRSKRNLARHLSNSGNEPITRNRSTSNHSSARKNIYQNPKANQRDTYDDLFMSGESTEEENNEDMAFIRSNTSNLQRATNDSSDPSASPATSQTHMLHQHYNRHVRYKKSPKRRKSLPPQSGSNNSSEQVHISTRPTCLPNALIPRGPLICSNIENLENYRIPSERSYNSSNSSNNTLMMVNKHKSPSSNNTNINLNSNNSNNTESSNSSLENTSSSYLKNFDCKDKSHLLKICNVINMADLINDKRSLAMPEETTDIDFNIPNIPSFKSQIYSEDNSNKYSKIPIIATTSAITNMEISKRPNLAIDNTPSRHNNRLHSLNHQPDKTLKNTSGNQNSKSLEDSCFISTLTNDNTENTYDYNSRSSNANPTSSRSTKTDTNKPRVDQIRITSKTSKYPEDYLACRNRNESDYDLDDFIEESLLSDAFSSNDEDNDVFIKQKLKEEERKRIILERENEKIKKELESANAQITSLKNAMSTIVSSDKINLIQDKMDSLNFSNTKTKDSEA